MELTTVIAGLSALAALASAGVAARSSAASRRSALMAEKQTQIAYQESAGRWEPVVELDIRRTSYRWSKDIRVWEEGGWADPGVGKSERFTLKEAGSQNREVEVVIDCILTNRGRSSVLLTAHDLDPSRFSQPLLNQRVFLIAGHPGRKAVIPPGVTLEVTWVDRRSLNEWREHHVAHERPRSWDTPELEPPRPSVWSAVKEAVRKVRYPWYSSRLEWESEVLGRSGFRFVIDTRVSSRIPEVWDARLGESPIVPVDRDDGTDCLRWKLHATALAPIDDDIVNFRCRRDMAFVQLETPRLRSVPGRF